MDEKLTVTEALAEIKTIQARIMKKRESIMRYFARDSRLMDPLEKDGGSIEFVRRERQAITDLETRLVNIRCAIQLVNLTTSLTIQNQTRSLAQWLNWRRDISTNAKQFLTGMASSVNRIRTEIQRKNSSTPTDSDKPIEAVFSVNETELSVEIEAMETLLGELDGKLSLMNATTIIKL